MDGIDLDSVFESGHEGGGGEVESEYKPVLSVVDKCLGSSDPRKLTVDVYFEELVTDSAVAGEDARRHQTHR